MSWAFPSFECRAGDVMGRALTRLALRRVEES